MALFRRGSSKISEENINCRLQREKAKTGTITASLAWNSPSDLDLHALVHLDAGGKAEISYNHAEAAGGKLDVDMHARDSDIVQEPVENIFWKKAPAGTYSIWVELYRKRGPAGPDAFRMLLKLEDEDEPKSAEGKLEKEKDKVECFRFTVDDEGGVTMGSVKAPMPAATQAPVVVPMKVAMRAMKAMKAMKVVRPKMKAKAKVKAKAKAKVKAKVKAKAKAKRATKVATGKKAKAEVFKGAKVKTKSGLKKEDLAKNKKGKIVSARRLEKGKQNKWVAATAKARALKGYTGFKPIKKGGSFYEKTKEVLSEM